MIEPTYSKPRTVAVIGGGITGLVAATKLIEQGIQVRLYEQSAVFGGSIRSDLVDGWLVEAGPNSLLDGDPEFKELIASLNLESEVLNARPEAKKRFIVRNSKVRAVPMGLGALLAARLFSWGMLFRMVSEIRQKPRLRETDVSLARFVADHFGQETVDYALNPIVGGVYAGSPELLSAKYAFPSLWKMEQEHGSIIKGQIAAAKVRKAKGLKRGKIVSFRRGLQTLVDALVSRVPVESRRLGSRVESLLPQNGSWTVESQVEGVSTSEVVDAVILAVPAYAMAGLRIGAAKEQPLACLSELLHPPVTSLFLGYRRDQIAHPLDGFGVLIPAVENRRELGVLFSSSLFDGRAPQGHVGLTVMVGGMRQPELAQLAPSEILRLVQPDLESLLGVRGAPVFQRCTAWKAAIPQYNIGYGRYLEAMEACEQNNPGLFIGGNARGGISVPNCISSGLRLAKAAT